MKLKNLTLAAAAALTLLSTPAISQGESGWQDADFSANKPLDHKLLNIWSDRWRQAVSQFREYVNPNLPLGASIPNRLFTKSYQVGDKTVLVSALSAFSVCDTGANSKDSSQVWSLCPARITVFNNNGSYESSVSTSACVGGNPNDKLGPRTNTQFKLDPFENRVSFRVLVNGKPAPGCDFSARFKL